MPTKNPFLTAEWRKLAMLNYDVEPSLLKPFIPAGTELDSYDGKFFVSVVGFCFLNTRVCGCIIPFHRNFEEVNLRFYVRRQTTEGWRRGVVFIRELVPRSLIAIVARTFYGEPYTGLPMRHSIQQTAETISVTYEWRRDGLWESIFAAANGPLEPVGNGSIEEFITEHYWGYTKRKSGSAEYQVEHPRWSIWRSSQATLRANVATLYGDAFAERLSLPPLSAFIADGSQVTVRQAGDFRTGNW